MALSGVFADSPLGLGHIEQATIRWIFLIYIVFLYVQKISRHAPLHQVAAFYGALLLKDLSNFAPVCYMFEQYNF